MDVELKYTQTDRDMIRDTKNLAQQILGNVQSTVVDLGALETRVQQLEQWRTAVVAVCGFVGFISGVVVKWLWH
jgi:hypothetical protein